MCRAHAAARRHGGDAVRGLQDGGVAAVAVAGQQDRLAALGLLQRRDQAEQARGAARVAHRRVQHVVDLRLLVEAQLLRDALHLAHVGGVEGEVRHVGGGQPVLLEGRRHAVDHDVGVALVHREAVLGRAHEGVLVRAPGVLDLPVAAVEVPDLGEASRPCRPAAPRRRPRSSSRRGRRGSRGACRRRTRARSRRSRPLTASSAALRALVPQRSDPPKSMVAASGGSSRTEAMVAADCFSL